MASKLIRLEDGTLLEVEALEGEVQEISSKFVETVNTTVDNIQPILVKICRPIVAAWKELNQEMNIEQAEIELGLSFEGEGNLYVTKSKAGANLNVKLLLKPNEEKGI